MLRSPSEYLTFLLDTHVYTFDAVGMGNPNTGPAADEPSDSHETDPLLPRSGQSDMDSHGETPDAGWLDFLCILARVWCGFAR